MILVWLNTFYTPKVKINSVELGSTVQIVLSAVSDDLNLFFINKTGLVTFAYAKYYGSVSFK